MTVSASIPVYGLRLCAKAISHQHQMSAERIAGASHGGLPRQALAADYTQDRPATLRAGFVRMVTSNSSLDASVYLPGRAIVAAPGLFHSVHVQACQPSRANTLAHQQFVDALADGLHVSSVLSSSLIAWSQPSEAAHGRVPKNSRAFHKSSGEFPNVCG